MKKIYEYFDSGLLCPEDICDNILPYNKVLCNITTPFLDGFINYVQPLVCFVLDHYIDIDFPIEDDRLCVSPKNDRFNHYYFKGTKRQLIQGVNSGNIQIINTKFHFLGDDIVILTKIADKKYMIFWYRMSGFSDIGRILTDDNESDVIKSVSSWLKEMKSKGDITGFHKLKIKNFLDGWLSF
jgi:hypothetical protein